MHRISLKKFGPLALAATLATLGGSNALAFAERLDGGNVEMPTPTETTPAPNPDQPPGADMSDLEVAAPPPETSAATSPTPAGTPNLEFGSLSEANQAKIREAYLAGNPAAAAIEKGDPVSSQDLLRTYPSAEDFRAETGRIQELAGSEEGGAAIGQEDLPVPITGQSLELARGENGKPSNANNPWSLAEYIRKEMTLSGLPPLSNAQIQQIIKDENAGNAAIRGDGYITTWDDANPMTLKIPSMQDFYAAAGKDALYAEGEEGYSKFQEELESRRLQGQTDTMVAEMIEREGASIFGMPMEEPTEEATEEAPSAPAAPAAPEKPAVVATAPAPSTPAPAPRAEEDPVPPAAPQPEAEAEPEPELVDGFRPGEIAEARRLRELEERRGQLQREVERHQTLRDSAKSRVEALDKKLRQQRDFVEAKRKAHDKVVAARKPPEGRGAPSTKKSRREADAKHRAEMAEHNLRLAGFERQLELAQDELAKSQAGLEKAAGVLRRLTGAPESD